MTHYFSQDVLEYAISEKDSQIAELEVKGVLDESETIRCDTLRTERDKLLNRLKTEVNIIIKCYVNISGTYWPVTYRFINYRLYSGLLWSV